MANKRFVIENVENAIGQQAPAVVLYAAKDGGAETREEWTTIEDLNRLFDACTRRWPVGWDLEKLLTCIRECEFD